MAQLLSRKLNICSELLGKTDVSFGTPAARFHFLGTSVTLDLLRISFTTQG